MSEVRAAAAAIARERSEGSGWGTEIDMAEVVRSNARRLREEAGWTQVDVAAAMRALGFGWPRKAASQVESIREDGSPVRKLSLDEIMGLAALYGVPAAEFLVRVDGDGPIGIGAAHLPAEALEELWIGRGGSLGAGGAAWHPALLITGDLDEVPATDLHRRREETRE